MIDARIDSMLPVHPAVRMLSDSAFRLYISTICWASLQQNGGCIPAAQLRYVSDVRRPQACAEQLADAGLWEAAGDGWQILDYLDRRPPSAKQVKRERKAGVIPLQQRDPA
jgi:hypothetical protein